MMEGATEGSRRGRLAGGGCATPSPSTAAAAGAAGLSPASPLPLAFASCDNAATTVPRAEDTASGLPLTGDTGAVGTSACVPGEVSARGSGGHTPSPSPSSSMSAGAGCAQGTDEASSSQRGSRAAAALASARLGSAAIGKVCVVSRPATPAADAAAALEGLEKTGSAAARWVSNPPPRPCMPVRPSRLPVS